MTISKAQQKATAKYVKTAYDRIEVKVAKGRKAEIHAHAEIHGESINGFINRAIETVIEQDSNKKKNLL